MKQQNILIMLLCLSVFMIIVRKDNNKQLLPRVQHECEEPLVTVTISGPATVIRDSIGKNITTGEVKEIMITDTGTGY